MLNFCCVDQFFLDFMNNHLKKRMKKMKRVPQKKKEKKGWIEYDFTENSNNKEGTLSSVLLLMKVEMFLF